MSNITDEMVKEFIRKGAMSESGCIALYKEWEQFKSSYVGKGSRSKEWEVISLEYKGSVSFWSTGRGYTLEEIQKNGYSIHSVKRLSDGQVFTIGDEIALTWYPNFNKGLIIIKEFIITDSKMFARYDKTSKYELPYIRIVEKAPSTPEREENKHCNVCGGEMVLIRGKYPGTDKRYTCPTCVTERLEQINDISSPGNAKPCKD